jgi:hypothetical protein
VAAGLLWVARVKYRRKPLNVTAKQWTGHNLPEIAAFIDDDVTVNRHSQIVLDTAFGEELASPYCWIVKNEMGHVTALSPQAFSDTYEAI